MKYISFFFLFLLASCYLQAARVTVTNHDGSVQNFNCACSCAEVQAYTNANPNEYRSVSCSERQSAGGNNFNAQAECSQEFNGVKIVVPSIDKFPPKPTPTDPGIPADIKELFLMYEIGTNSVKVHRVGASSNWKAILNGITFTGAKKPYMFFYGKMDGTNLKINNQNVPVKDATITAKLGDILIDDVPIPFENVSGGGNGNGGGIPIDTAIFIKWPPKKGSNMTTAYFVAGQLEGDNFDVRGVAAKPVEVKPGGTAKTGMLLINGVPVETDYQKPNNGGGGIVFDTAIQIKWPPKKNKSMSTPVTGSVAGNSISIKTKGMSKEVDVQAKTGMLLINGVPVDTDFRAPGDPEKPKGCCCVEEPSPGEFTMKDIECPGGDCVKCCADAKNQGGKDEEVPAEMVEAIQKGKYSGEIGGRRYYFGGGNGKNEEQTTYPYHVLVFSNSKFVVTNEGINNLPQTKELYVVAMGGLKKLPPTVTLGKIAAPSTHRTLPRPLGPVPSYLQGNGCSYMKCSVTSSLDFEEITWEVYCCSGNNDCCATLEPMGGLDLTKAGMQGDDDENGGNNGGSSPYHVVVFSNGKFVVTKEAVNNLPNKKELYAIGVGSLKKLPPKVALGKIADPSTHRTLPRPLGPVPSYLQGNGCSYMKCSVTSSLDFEEITWEVYCCPGNNDCCATLEPMGGLDLTKEGMQGDDDENGGNIDPSTRENVTIFIYKDERYAVVAGKQTSKDAEETLYGTVKKGSKIDADEKSAKRSPLPTITTTIPEEPQDPQEARGCRRLGCTTVNCRKCREYQEKLKQGDSRDIQLN